MNHSELQEKLFDGYDGRLDAEQAGMMQAHLNACSECRLQLDSWKQTAQTFLTPLRTSHSHLFTQNVMRQIRNSQAATLLALPRLFARWAFPAFALSLGSFAAALLYVAQPLAVGSADGLFASDQQAAPSEWITNAANEDQILGSVVEKP